MRALCREWCGYGPLGLLLALLLVLIAVGLGLDAVRLAVTGDPLLVLAACIEVGGVWAALYMTRRLQDAVTREENC